MRFPVHSPASMIRNLLSQPVVLLFWLLHFLPLQALAPIGRALGLVLYHVGNQRRNIVRVNLELCFPELDDAARRRLYADSFESLGIALFIPFGISATAGPVPLLIAGGFMLLKLAVGGFVLALIETLNAKMRIFRAPEFLGTAFLLAVLAMLVHLLLEAGR